MLTLKIIETFMGFEILISKTKLQINFVRCSKVWLTPPLHQYNFLGKTSMQNFSEIESLLATPIKVLINWTQEFKKLLTNFFLHILKMVTYFQISLCSRQERRSFCSATELQNCDAFANFGRNKRSLL